MTAARIARALGIVACMVSGVPLAAGGQEGPASEAMPAGMTALEAGDVVRVFFRPHGLVEGRMLAPWPAASLRAEIRAPPGGVIELPIALIDSLSVRRGHGGIGAFVGSVVGAGLGALALHGIGNLACEAPDNDCDTGPSTAAWVGFVVGGATLGAGIGWLVGRDSRYWESLHP